MNGYTLMTEEQRAKIVRRIGQLPIACKPSWQDVIDIALTVTRKEYRRQSLWKHDAIKDALELRVSQHEEFLLNGIKPTPEKLPETEDPKVRTLRQVRQKLDQAQETIRLQDQRLVRLIANAAAMGLNTTLLDKDLDKPERRATDAEVRPIR
ncbi:hypothetical protein [Sphingomonas sp.]|uniref:hypothetical protein n=1 Tax=Sphingomonas sp. TaxID=28214 RepID=UPI0035BC5822